jgi:hypothetical protein
LDDLVYWAIAGVIAAAVAADLAFNGGGATVFVARKIMDLVLYLTFWRH